MCLFFSLGFLGLFIMSSSWFYFFFLRVMSLFVVVLVYFLFEGRLWSLSLSLRGESWATYCLLLLAKLRIQFPDLVMDKKQARSFL